MPGEVMDATTGGVSGDGCHRVERVEARNAVKHAPMPGTAPHPPQGSAPSKMSLILSLRTLAQSRDLLLK